MARRGSFGTSVNPFGTGTFGNLAQYDIGDNLKDLAAYQAEIAWGNGTITDAQYQASLAALAAAATPGTQTQLSAYNKLEDVTYRIGRSEADAAGLDALIAFDQQALAGMDPNNLRYRSVKSSLDSELAQRRSRDYGAIIADYNAGRTSTESVLAWVENILASLPGDAPDLDNWTSVRASLSERITNEIDAQVYQDYQDRKIAPEEFISYLTGRRDAYNMDSPQWAEADRRLKDAEQNVRATAQAKIDQDVANRYAEGKISDNTYLVWLNKRIAAMEPDDPDLPAWKHRLTQAAHSVAEDKLRHDVVTAKTAAAEATARKNLRTFYEAYALTLNPGSAEFRATEERILALKPQAVTTGGGGGGGGGGAAPVTPPGSAAERAAIRDRAIKAGKPAPTEAAITATLLKNLGKIIPTTGNFDSLLGLMTPRATDPKKDQAADVANLRLNLDNANTALRNGDKVWLYVDPRYPGQTVPARNPDGTLALDASGKSFKTFGSAYRTVLSDEVAAMQGATAQYQYGLASIAAAKGDDKAYSTALWHGNNALDAVRTTQAHAVQVNITDQLKALDAGIVAATKTNDPATVVNLLTMKRNVIADALLDHSLDQGQRDSLEKQADAIWANPLFPLFDTDAQGNMIRGADGQYVQIHGLVDLGTSPQNADGSLVAGGGVLIPGGHYVLGTDSTGRAAPHYEWEDPRLGTWGNDHVQVLTSALGQVVKGEVKVTDAPSLKVWVTDQNGVKHAIDYGLTAKYFSFIDGSGNRVNGYSVDGGRTWVQATGGIIPELELNRPVVWTPNTDGTVAVTVGGNVVFSGTPSGDGYAWTSPANALNGAPIAWYGQYARESGGDYSGGVGAQGQDLRIVTTEMFGGLPSVNLIPRSILYPEPRVVTTTQLPSRTTRTIMEPAEAAITSALGPGRLPSPFGRSIIEPREAPPFDAGAWVSGLISQAQPTLAAIVNLGATLLDAVLPPPFAGTPVITYTQVPVPGMRSIMEPVLPTVTTAPPKVTVAPAPARVISPTQRPSTTTRQIVEPPEPAPVAKPPPLVKPGMAPIPF